MPEVQMHGKNQVTIPASIIKLAHLPENCTFDVEYIDGAIVFTPQTTQQKSDDVMSYAGLFAGAWGETNTDVEQTIRELHKEWEK